MSRECPGNVTEMYKKVEEKVEEMSWELLRHVLEMSRNCAGNGTDMSREEKNLEQAYNKT